ncbi:MAG: GNAT family N-acetyltransferase [Dehalococcoidia bacterium]
MAAQTARGADDAAAHADRVRFIVRPLRDRSTIRALLEPQRVYAAYAIGQLASALFPFVRCWFAENDQGEGLVIHSAGGLGDAMLTFGDPAAVEAILRVHRGPHGNFATCRSEHLPAVERYFRIAHQNTMARMAVTAETFRPVEPADGHTRVLRLRAAHARAVNRLYNTEGAPTFYSAAHIESGYYYGVYHDGRLVAVAGTHVVSPEEGVAVVGNVFTHPGFRGHGYATIATSATTAALLAECQDVVLTVDPRNTPAIHAYLRLGYREVCRLVEAPVSRRDLIGLGSGLQRLLARWRGRGLGAEIVE